MHIPSCLVLGRPRMYVKRCVQGQFNFVYDGKGERGQQVEVAPCFHINQWKIDG